ncbi:hypothetical protein H6G74_01505 [Nostoc spongiaeforme FACHB-130]|uniref:HTH cro/C1-type domain-containing protein n=1 Tax=Nostoc spongiaeforme FACHB-130 TaxID=1357510 RepID=A0ABR8FPD8_9NOSO|nr:hypothetical protein [Nostoc spongiaeforme]MBD2593004.1 hypothetical protein [Nostoc spongiaeforme FACHB-130]
MDINKRQRLEAAAWRIGDAADFLELSSDEVAFIEIKLSLSRQLKQLRVKNNLTQTELAQKTKFNRRLKKMDADKRR